MHTMTSTSRAQPAVRRSALSRLGERVWRLRKLHQHVDAVLQHDAAGVDLGYFYNGKLAYTRRLTTRDQAMREAHEKRAELEREGWTAHW
jgi:hypothetical protein